MRAVHPLDGPPLDPDVVGALGARLSGLTALDVPVAPGFVVGTAAWHLGRLVGDEWGIPATIAEQLGSAMRLFADDVLLSVKLAPAAVGATTGPALFDVGLNDTTFDALARRTSLGFARRAFRDLGAPRTGRFEQLVRAITLLLARAPTPSAVVVQARTYAEGKAPSGHGVVYTRDPVGGAVWPVGTFRSGRSSVDIDELSRSQPEVGIGLRAALARIETLHEDVRRVSFTVEAGSLWVDDAEPVRRPLDGHGAQAALDPEDQQRHLCRQLGR